MKKLILLLFIPLISYSQSPSGKAYELFTLINEARTNPKLFLNKYKNDILKYEPKFAEKLKKSIPIKKIIWDEGLALNCKQRIYGNLSKIRKSVRES